MSGVSIHFCPDFTTSQGPIIVPISLQGLKYPVPGLKLNQDKVNSAFQLTIFGNCLLLGSNSSGKPVFGLVTDEFMDKDFIWTSLKNSIQQINAKISLKTCSIVPIFRGNESDFEEEINCYLFYLVLESMQSGDLYVCHVEELGWVRSLLGKVQGQIEGVEVRFPGSRAEKVEEMKRYAMHCEHCWEYLEDAVSTVCCHVPVCAGCSRYVAMCPMCRVPAQWVVNRYLRSRTADMVYVCMCEMEVVMKELQMHKLKCALSQFRCKLCGWEGVGREECLRHLETGHAEQLIKTAAR